jgi:hypothetical protein
MSRKLKFPILIRAAAYAAHQPFMAQTIEDLAVGICPSSVQIRGNCIVCSFPKNNFVYRINENGDPAQICNELSALLREHLLPHSTSADGSGGAGDDTSAQPTSWQDVRKKNLKDILLYRYVVSQGVKTQVQQMAAVEHIRMLLVLKIILPKNIHFDDQGMIKSIDNILFQDGCVVSSAETIAALLTASTSSLASTPMTRVGEKTKSANLYDMWSLYISGLV